MHTRADEDLRVTVRAPKELLGLSKGLPPPLSELPSGDLVVVLLVVVVWLFEFVTVVVMVALPVEVAAAVWVDFVESGVETVWVVGMLGLVGFAESVMILFVGTCWDESFSVLDPIGSVVAFDAAAVPALPVVVVTTATLQRTWMPSPSRNIPSTEASGTESCAQYVCTSALI